MSALQPNAVAEEHRTQTTVPDCIVLGGQARSVLDVYDAKELSALYSHLHNGNNPMNFVMGFRDENGAKRYVRSKKLHAEKAIEWAINTIRGKTKSPLAYVPRASNDRQESRFCGWDFDAHDGNAERACRFALAAFRLLLNERELFAILETSGSGGCHVWAIRSEFWPVHHWQQLLKSVAATIGAPLAPGICEIFPPDSTPSEFGKGLRAPGGWNPATDTFSEILSETCRPLINSLMRVPIEEESNVITLYRDTLRGERPIYRDTLWPIAEPATRRNQLKKLVANAFFKAGLEVARLNAELQFKEKTVETEADFAEHLREFGELWEWTLRRWIGELQPSERTIFDALATDRAQDAFRLVRSFHRSALQRGDSDFPISRDSLAARLGVVPTAASKIRDKLARLGAIKQTAKHVPHKASARFRWMADKPQVVTE